MVGEQVPVGAQVLPVVQRACVKRRQVAAAVLQQTPGEAQVLGAHVPPASQSCAAGPQLDWEETAQVPVTTLQHAPCGGGQGLVAHTTPARQLCVETEQQLSGMT